MSTEEIGKLGLPVPGASLHCFQKISTLDSFPLRCISFYPIRYERFQVFKIRVCYLLNKLIFNRSTQTINFWIVMKISGHSMKDVWVINKVGISGVLFFKKFESF